MDELEAQIHKKKIEMGLEIEVVDGSLQRIAEQLSEKEKLLKLAIDDESRNEIQKEIDELTGQKAEIELKLKPVVEDGDLEELTESIREHSEEVTVKVR